ncbi:hypothetical protein BJV74DRAFT_821449 [Russula compacta]|nr:hypothetical protein BJV74DRAFT_821449 [Russula compacta]
MRVHHSTSLCRQVHGRCGSDQLTKVKTRHILLVRHDTDKDWTSPFGTAPPISIQHCLAAPPQTYAWIDVVIDDVDDMMTPSVTTVTASPPWYDFYDAQQPKLTVRKRLVQRAHHPEMLRRPLGLQRSGRACSTARICITRLEGVAWTSQGDGRHHARTKDDLHPDTVLGAQHSHREPISDTRGMGRTLYVGRGTIKDEDGEDKHKAVVDRPMIEIGRWKKVRRN